MRLAEALLVVATAAVALQLAPRLQPADDVWDQREFEAAAEDAFLRRRAGAGAASRLSAESAGAVEDAVRARAELLLRNASSDSCRSDLLRGMRLWAERALLAPRPPQFQSACTALAASGPPLAPRDVKVLFVVFGRRSATATARLAAALRHPQHQVFVHFDARAPAGEWESLRQLLEPWTRSGSVVLLQTRSAVTEGGFAQSHAAVEFFKLAVRGTDPALRLRDWRFVGVLGEGDYPLRPHAELHAALRDPDAVLINRRSGDGGGVPPHFVVDCDGELHQLGPVEHPLRAGMRVATGQPWGLYSRAFVRYLVSGAEPQRAVITDLQHWPNADDYFFPTALANSPMCHAPSGDVEVWLAQRRGCVEGLPYCRKQLQEVSAADLPLMQMGGALFGGGFPADAAELFDAVDEWRAPGFAEAPGLPLALRSGDGDGDGEGRCLTVGEGRALAFEDCEPGRAEQQFELGPCSVGAVAVDPATGCVEATGGASPPVCQLRAMARAAQDECVDLYRGDTGAGAEVGLWPCHRNFNQLWTARNCSIAASSPRIARAEPAGVCLTEGAGGAAESYPCGRGPTEASQRLVVV